MSSIYRNCHWLKVEKLPFVNLIGSDRMVRKVQAAAAAVSYETFFFRKKNLYSRTTPTSWGWYYDWCAYERWRWDWPYADVSLHTHTTLSFYHSFVESFRLNHQGIFLNRSFSMNEWIATYLIFNIIRWWWWTSPSCNVTSVCVCVCVAFGLWLKHYTAAAFI